MTEINWWTWSMHSPPLGWFLLNFGLFVFLLVRAVKKPMREAFLRRHTNIKTSIDDNRAALASANLTFEEARAKLAAIDHEARTLVARIKQDATQERDRIIESARAYAERMQKDTAGLLQQEVKLATMRLRNDLAHEALKQAAVMLKKELSQKDRERLLDAALLDLEQAAVAP